MGSTPSCGMEPWEPFPWMVRKKPSDEEEAAPAGRMPMDPAGSLGITCAPKMASTPLRTPLLMIGRAPPGDFSSPGWKMKYTVPGNSFCMEARTLAGPSSMAVCMSCPQAWLTPGVLLAKENPVSSCTGRASMSARKPTVFPGFPPRRMPTTEVFVGRRTSMWPNEASRSAT